MKTVIAFVLLFLGVVLMNSPPVMDQDFTTDVNLEMVSSIDMNQDFAVMATMNMEAQAQGGVILQTYDATWSATISNEISKSENEHDQRQISWVEPTKEGPMRLELYSPPATWRIQETYM